MMNRTLAFVLICFLGLISGQGISVSFAQKTESKTEDNLNKKKPKPSRRVTKFKKKNNQILANDQKGNTVTKIDKSYNLRSKNFQNSNFEPPMTTFPSEKKKLAKKSNEVITQDQQGNSVSHVDKKYNLRSKSLQSSAFEPATTTHPTERKKLAAKANRIITQDESGNSVSHVDKKYNLRSKS
ncbi:MAG TPA: hypothetical protein PLK63_15115, partial [Catalimonadaceae bacterium]|nr:hypothetical protein [Catalimonadaceae bacterium]